MFWLINFASQWHHLHLRLARWLSLNTLMHFSASSCQLFLFLCNSEFIASGILIFFGFLSSLLFVSDHHRNKNCFCQFACLHCLCIPTHRQNYKKKSATVMINELFISKKPRQVKKSVYRFIAPSDSRKTENAVTFHARLMLTGDETIVSRVFLPHLQNSPVNCPEWFEHSVWHIALREFNFHSRKQPIESTVCVMLIIHNILHVSH